MLENKVEIWDTKENRKVAIFSGIGPALKFLSGGAANGIYKQVASPALMQFSPDGTITEYSGETLQDMMKAYGEAVAKVSD